MNTAEVVIIVLAILGCMIESYNHGKTKKGNHNIWVHLISVSITLALMYWAGLFR